MQTHEIRTEEVSLEDRGEGRKEVKARNYHGTTSKDAASAEISEATKARFWSKVDKRGDDECWTWLGGRMSRYGHGAFWFRKCNIGAHVFSYILSGGRFQNGPLVRHKECRNPRCVNPKHLADGTFQDNADDRVKDGTSAKGDKNGSRLHPERLKRGKDHPSYLRTDYLPHGSNHWRAKLSEADVLEMRRLKAEEGLGCCKLAKRFNMSLTNAKDILAKRTWRHI